MLLCRSPSVIELNLNSTGVIVVCLFMVRKVQWVVGNGRERRQEHKGTPMLADKKKHLYDEDIIALLDDDALSGDQQRVALAPGRRMGEGHRFGDRRRLIEQ